MAADAVVLDAPGVGSNLQDHLDTYIQYECQTGDTLYPDAKVRRFQRFFFDCFLFVLPLPAPACNCLHGAVLAGNVDRG